MHLRAPPADPSSGVPVLKILRILFRGHHLKHERGLFVIRDLNGRSSGRLALFFDPDGDPLSYTGQRCEGIRRYDRKVLFGPVPVLIQCAGAAPSHAFQ